MTTDEHIENLEKGLATARRLNRWLLAAVGLALGVWILAGTLGLATAGAPAGDLPRYQIAVAAGWSGPFVVDTYTGDIFLAPSSTDAQQWKKEPSKVMQRAWYKIMDGPPR